MHCFLGSPLMRAGHIAMCRKKKAVHKTTSTDDKRLQNTLKRLGVNTIPGIEEVNIFKDDSVIHFVNPKGGSERKQGQQRRAVRVPAGGSVSRHYVCSSQCKRRLPPTPTSSAALRPRRVSLQSNWAGAKRQGATLTSISPADRDPGAAARHPEPDGARQPGAPEEDDAAGVEVHLGEPFARMGTVPAHGPCRLSPMVPNAMSIC